MSIKDEVERLKREQADREAILKAELAKELDAIFSNRLSQSYALVELYFKALQETGCVSCLNDLRKSSNLTYSTDSPEQAPIIIGTDLQGDGQSLSDFVTCDIVKFQANIDYSRMRNDWLNQISIRVYELT